MLTPAFELKQNDDWLTILIKTPFAKISETEIYIDGSEFKFYSKPYYLRLNLPGNIVEDGRESAKYDSDKGSFTVQIPKENPGEYFEGLDMLTKLLAPAGQKSAASPLIEVLDGEDAGPIEDAEVEYEDEDEWLMEQEVYDDSEDSSISLESPMYGFANQQCGVFKRLQQELHDIIDLKDADATPMAKRRELRLSDEQNSFSDDHYLADLYQDEVIQEILKYKPVWLWEYSCIKNKQKEESVVEFTAAEKEKMRNLPRKEYLLDSKTRQIAFLGLVDIIFAYCYNKRSTEGENNVESGWTISKLSGTLSWLETYKNPKDVLISCYRRCLSYPLFRSWKLNEKVFRDVQKIFTIGRRRILKCLLEIKELLQDNDSRYILNDLYITDYCVWIQSVSQRKLESLTRCLKETVIEKEDVCLDLVELEMAGTIAMDESVNNGHEEDEDLLNLSHQFDSSMHLTADMSLLETGETPRKNPVGLRHKKDIESLIGDDGVCRTQTKISPQLNCTWQQDSDEDDAESETEDSSSEYETDSEGSEDECEAESEPKTENADKIAPHFKSTPDTDSPANGKLITDITDIDELQIPTSDSAKDSQLNKTDTLLESENSKIENTPAAKLENRFKAECGQLLPPTN